MTPERIAELRDTAIRLSPVSWLGVGADYHEMLDEIERLRGLVAAEHVFTRFPEADICSCGVVLERLVIPDSWMEQARADHVQQILDGGRP